VRAIRGKATGLEGVSIVRHMDRGHKASARFVHDTWADTPDPVRTILVAGVGTIVGAWVTSRSQTKRRILDELRAITAARALCFSVTNRAMGLKRRHVRPLCARHTDFPTSVFRSPDRTSRIFDRHHQPVDAVLPFFVISARDLWQRRITIGLRLSLSQFRHC
jgi:hypothetical protein